MFITTDHFALTSCIGRQQEIVAARTRLFCDEVRLLTLTGCGGVGKTRLGLHIATEARHDFADGVCFVSLSSLRDASSVLPCIAQSLGLHQSETQPPLEHVKAALRERHLLLVLDNFEHVIAAAPSLAELLTSCPRLKILVTGREVLQVRGEHTLVVSPLPLPDGESPIDAEAAMSFGAVALFVERAREVCPTFQLTNENALLVAKICQRLDGLPLAIELAAARLKVLSLQALLGRLEHRLQILTGGARDLPVRQQSLRNTIQWSYDLLSPEEQHLFLLLSVFAGGYTLEAVEVVYGMLGGEREWVLDGITSLLNKHLLYQRGRKRGEPCLEMLETLREYGWERLALRGEAEQARLAYAQYSQGLAEKAEAHVFGAEEAEWFDTQTLTRAWTEGLTLAPEQVLALPEYTLLPGQALIQSYTRGRINGNKSKSLASQDGLTGREGEVLHLVGQGLTDAQVAERLVISPRTVHAHLRSIYGKLQITSRYAAIHYALKHHLSR